MNVIMKKEFRIRRTLRSGLVNLWHACPKWHAETSLARGIHLSHFLNFFCPTSVSILWTICVHTYTCLTA